MPWIFKTEMRVILETVILFGAEWSIGPQIQRFPSS